MKLNESAKSFASANAEDRLCRMNLRASFRVLALVSLSAIALALPASAERKCSSGEIARVFGKIQFVSSFPDYKVQVVTSFPDLKVRKVTSFPDAPGKWQIVSVVLAFVGAALLMGQSLELSPAHFSGDLLSLAAGLAYTVYLLLMMRVRESTESWGALGMASGVAAVVLLPAAFFAGEKIIPDMWWPVLLLAFSSQFLGQGCLTYALPHFSPLVIGLALLLQPALSAAAGWLAFGEVMTTLDFTGSLLVMAALVLVRKQ